MPTEVDAKLFANGGRSDFVVLERACAILSDAGRLDGKESIVDVGAHVGTTSIAALVNHGFVRAVAIEPDPAHLPLLRANIALNGLHERVAVIEAAMSDDRRREQPFLQGSRKEASYRWMKGRLVEERAPGAVAVDTVSLDGLAADAVVDPATTGLLWFDCSGCEQQALRASSAFLEHRVPLVLTLRRGQFTESTPLLERLQSIYEHVIDLRSPNLADPITAWAPTLRPVHDLVLLPEGKKLTDVLVF